ncbi:MarR family transcriptional regulator [Opitutaceae bacterium EW11]|nr:MarR family transcriptional regulator [Opitutaceae bacterium EW11]
MASRDAQGGVAVESIRQFNRFYTRKIGVLQEGLLESRFSLSEGRVLYELAHARGMTAAELVRDLGIDAGYLSRMLARFVRQGLLRRERSEQDARQTHLHLTAKGRAAFSELNRRSSRQIRELIHHLPVHEQGRLASHLQMARQLLHAGESTSSSVVLRDPRPGDYGWVIERHGALYAAEYGWSAEFEALVARIVADYMQQRDAGRERCWIADLEGVPVGCVFLVRHTQEIAKLRLLLVDPAARGRGVGQQLVNACLSFAAGAGYRKIQLWTNSVLTAARHLYERSGFRLVGTEPHNSFGHDLVGETWERDL